jgi:hypothetical protein
MHAFKAGDVFWKWRAPRVTIADWRSTGSQPCSTHMSGSQLRERERKLCDRSTQTVNIWQRDCTPAAQTLPLTRLKYTLYHMALCLILNTVLLIPDFSKYFQALDNKINCDFSTYFEMKITEIQISVVQFLKYLPLLNKTMKPSCALVGR